MIYTKAIKKELDTILKAFEGYIQNQNYFDIVYSEKIGYIWLIIYPPGAAGAELLDTPEKMLDALFNDIINEVINSPENTTHIPDTLKLTKYEEKESRRRITTILETIADGRDKYLDYLNSYLKDYQERYSEDDEA